MSLLADIKNYSVYQYLKAMLVFVGVLAPGFLALYLFKPTFIIELDIFKLLFFSASITTPIYVFNLLCVSFASPHGGDDDAFIALLLTAVILYPILVCVYSLHLIFQHFLYLVVGVEMLCAVFCVLRVVIRAIKETAT